MIWKTYLNDKLIAAHPDGFFVIRPAQMCSEANPLFCPVCDNILLTVYDDESYKKFQCCDGCANSWVYPNLEKWKKGWRPNRDVVLNKSIMSPI